MFQHGACAANLRAFHPHHLLFTIFNFLQMPSSWAWLGDLDKLLSPWRGWEAAPKGMKMGAWLNKGFILWRASQRISDLNLHPQAKSKDRGSCGFRATFRHTCSHMLHTPAQRCTLPHSGNCGQATPNRSHSHTHAQTHTCVHTYTCPYHAFSLI